MSSALISTLAKRAKAVPSRRHVALLGGTTTLSDCIAALGHLTAPHRLLEGPAIAEYEQTFAEVIGVRHAYSFSSGRVGLYGILRALGVGAGDEVLLQVPTHIVVANAIRYVGARPVYVDCTLDDYNIDLRQAEEKVTTRTKALILQHTFGIPSNLGSALEFRRRYGCTLIEDCVHALGSKYDGRHVGSFGDAAFFSTEETKTISTTMGGMVVTDDDELAARLRAFQDSCSFPSGSLVTRYLLKLVLYHFLTAPQVHAYTRALYELLGSRNPLPGPTTGEEVRGQRPANYETRLSNAQAAVGLWQLRRLEENVHHRRYVSNAYQMRLASEGIEPPHAPPGSDPAFVRYPVYVQDRAAVVRAAAAHGVLGTWFTSVLEEAVAPRYGDYEKGSCPRAELAAEHLVNLPTHQRVTAADVEAIAGAVTHAI